MVLYALVLVTLAGLVVADFDPELHAKYLSMPKSAFIEYFNSRNYSWKISDNTNLLEKFKFQPFVHRDKENLIKIPTKTHDLEEISLPTNFDSRTQWPQCESIKAIFDQGDCLSAWAFSVATTATDRTCIHKDIHVNLSVQDFECVPSNVCGGYRTFLGFKHWVTKGFVSEQCKPYDVESLKKIHCHLRCNNSKIKYSEDKHFGDEFYNVDDDADQIKAEIVKNGPIQTDFSGYEDFLDYSSGVYEHLYGELLGSHHVRVIGYGVEDGKDYWLATNSWGSEWGDKGTFKIQTFQPEIQFEEFMMTGLPKN